MESLGTLIDKLSIVNIKIYHQEDIAHDPGSSLEEVGKAKLKINQLNDQRTDLVQEIDELFTKVMYDINKLPKIYRSCKDWVRTK